MERVEAEQLLEAYVDLRYQVLDGSSHPQTIKRLGEIQPQLIDALVAVPSKMERVEARQLAELFASAAHEVGFWHKQGLASGSTLTGVVAKREKYRRQIVDALCRVRPREPSRLDECRADLRANGTMLAWIEEEVKHAKIERLVAGRRVSVLEDLQEKALIRAGRIERAIGLEEEEAGLE